MPSWEHGTAIAPMNSQHCGYLYKTSTSPSQPEFQYGWEGAHERPSQQKIYWQWMAAGGGSSHW